MNLTAEKKVIENRVFSRIFSDTKYFANFLKAKKNGGKVGDTVDPRECTRDDKWVFVGGGGRRPDIRGQEVPVSTGVRYTALYRTGAGTVQF